MNQKISLEDLPNFVVNLSLKVDQLLEQIGKLNHNAVETPVWFDIDGLCDYLPQKPAKQTVYEWCSKRKIPFHKVGKHIIFLKAEIDEWLLNSNIKSDTKITDDAIKYINNKKKQ